jgi:hypothetical protein
VEELCESRVGEVKYEKDVKLKKGRWIGEVSRVEEESEVGMVR